MSHLGGGVCEDQSRRLSDIKNTIYTRLAGKNIQDFVVKMDDTKRDRIRTLRTTLVRHSILTKENDATEQAPPTNNNNNNNTNWKEEAENEFQAFILF
jgi:hypothetical protein